MAYVPEILCVDDQEELLDFLSRSLAAAGYEVVACSSWLRAKSLLGDGQIRPDLIILEPLIANGNNGTVQELCELAGRTPVVAFSSSQDPKVIVKTIQEGARNFLSKPATADQLRRFVSEAVSEKKEDSSRRKATAPVDFICKSRAIQEVQKTALRVARSTVPVLVTGETGVGKDVVARFIHENSNLADRPFVKVNCAAMPAELVESELFGYRKGAFTGAYIDRPGKFEFANNGTIFLDEIAEFNSSVQAKLLQVLQDGHFSRLGFDEEVQVQVRVLAATNRKLEDAIREGKFREDLYYRLNVVNINISPLRHRSEDIPVFCDYFLQKFSKQYETEVDPIPPALAATFLEHRWPGNVRELENLIKRYVVLRDAETIQVELEQKMSGDDSAQIEMIAGQVADRGAGSDNLDLKEMSRRAVCQVERNMIVKTLRKTNWNKSQAARELRVSYKTLLTKIEQYEIKPGSL